MELLYIFLHLLSWVMCAFARRKSADKGGRDKIRRLRPGLPGLSGCPGLSFLVVWAVSASSGGDIKITENTARAQRSKPGRCFNQPVATGSTLLVQEH